jgi:hypothetical protein
MCFCSAFSGNSWPHNFGSRHFLPHCPTEIQKRCFFQFSQHFTSGEAHLWHMVSSMFVWRGLTTDITAWSRACLHCQQAKICCHMRLQPQPVPIPQLHFSHLHIDLVEPLQYSGGCNFFFTIIDHTSKWMEAIPLSYLSAAFIFSWISLLGSPNRSFPNMGRNLLYIFGPSFVKCYTFYNSKQQHIILSRMV